MISDDEIEQLSFECISNKRTDADEGRADFIFGCLQMRRICEAKAWDLAREAWNAGQYFLEDKDAPEFDEWKASKLEEMKR